MIEIVVIPKSELLEMIQQALIARIDGTDESQCADVMTLRQLCKYLATSPPTVKKKIGEGLPVSYRLGDKSPRFIKSEILDWLSGRAKS